MTVLAKVRGMALGVAWVAALGTPWGCGDPGASRQPWSIQDSMGVEVVTSPEGVLNSAPRWSLGATPLLDLGTVTGGGPTEFYEVTDVRLVPGERVVVANKGSEELRFFSLDGEHLHSAGRPGNGPREFDGLAMVRARRDSLVTYDGGNDRFSVRGPWGEYARSFRLDWIEGLLVPEDLVGGEGILAITARHMTQLTGAGLLVDTALVSRYDLEGHLVDSMARLPHNVRFVSRSGDWQTTLGAPLTPFAALVATPDGFCYAFGPAQEIRCYGDGGALTRILRVAVPPRPVTQEDVQAYWTQMRERLEGEAWARYNRLRDQMPMPDAFASFDRLILDDQGRIWARRYQPLGDPAPVWWVFEDGALAAVCEAPRDFWIHQVRGDRVVGVWRDELGVEHVRIHRLDTGGETSG